MRLLADRQAHFALSSRGRQRIEIEPLGSHG